MDIRFDGNDDYGIFYSGSGFACAYRTLNHSSIEKAGISYYLTNRFCAKNMFSSHK